MDRGKLYAAAALWCGVFTLWSFEYAVAVPYFRRLGFSAQVSYLLWCAGPVSGLVVGPVVGVSSDRCRSRHGRRRPFIAGGVVATVVAAGIFAAAQSVAEDACAPGAARALAVIGFWLMDLSINTVQNPARALMSDIAATQEEQVLGQSTIAQCCGLGYVLGFSIVSFWPDALGQLKYVYAVGISILLLTSGITLCLTHEQSTAGAAEMGVSSSINTGETRRYSPGSEQRKPSSSPSSSSSSSSRQERGGGGSACDEVSQAFRQIFAGIASMDRPIVIIALCQLFTWFAWFCFSPVLTDLFGQVLYGGDPAAVCNVTAAAFHNASSGDGAGCQAHVPSSAGNATGPRPCVAPSCQPCNHIHDGSVGCAKACSYGKGVSAGALALMLQNIFTVCCSFAVPLLQRRVPALTVQRVYTLALACMSLLMFCVSMFNGGSVGATSVFVCLMGLAQYGSQTFPYALMGMAVPDSEKGLFMGVLTLAIVVPQLLDVTYTGSLADGAGVEWVVFVGAVWAALAAGATVCLPPSDALRRRAGGTKSAAAGDDAGLFTQLDDDEGA